MKKLVLPHKLYRDAEVGKVTAGIPAVDPLQRAILEARGLKKDWQDEAVAESERNAWHAVMPDGERTRGSLEAQMGKPLTGFQVKAKLEKINPSLVITAYPEQKQFRIGLLNRDAREDYERDIRIAWMPMGTMPEFSQIHMNQVRRIDPASGGFVTKLEINEKDPETRGWRTVLIRCIKSGAITRTQAEKAFGLPAHESLRWAEMIGDR